MTKYRRKIKLIKPSIQLHMTMVVLGVSTLGLLLQFNLFASRLTQVALALPKDGPVLADQMGGLLMDLFLTSAVLFLPLIFAVGILVTFRFAGPIYRFEGFLKQVLAGENPPECKIRKGDHLWDLCHLLNQVTAPLRQPKTQPKRNSSQPLEDAPSLVSSKEEEVEAGQVEQQEVPSRSEG